MRSCALVAVLAIGCASAPAPPSREEPPEDLRRRCSEHVGDREACARDLACVPGRPIRSCGGGHVCTDGGPVSCLPCSVWVALEARAPLAFCDARAAGKHRTACELLHRDDPARCAALVDAP